MTNDEAGPNRTGFAGATATATRDARRHTACAAPVAHDLPGRPSSKRAGYLLRAATRHLADNANARRDTTAARGGARRHGSWRSWPSQRGSDLDQSFTHTTPDTDTARTAFCENPY